MGDPVHEEHYYRVKLVFKHDTRFHTAGSVVYLWRRHDWGWQVWGSAQDSHRFPILSAAREAAKNLGREDFGRDKCCERVIERVTESVERVVRVKAPPRGTIRKKKVKKKRRSCGDCRSR